MEQLTNIQKLTYVSDCFVILKPVLDNPLAT